jgi:alkyl sulfatase BDS1-like metallo-beta-lactamase superfamily hydrolase
VLTALAPRRGGPAVLTIERPVETHRVDGVEIGFQLAPDTEAPA